MYRPADGSGVPYPVVVQIYGGAWQRGTPSDNDIVARELAARGFIVFAIGYRHAPRWRWPAQLDDVRMALRWIRQNGSRYGADSSRIAMFGRSAGAHLAMLAAYERGAPPVRAVVNYYGPVDLIEGYRQPPRPDPLDVRQVEIALFGGSPDRFAEAYRAASPIAYATRTLPPTLSIYGARDHIVEPRFGRMLDAPLRAAGTTKRVAPGFPGPSTPTRFRTGRAASSRSIIPSGFAPSSLPIRRLVVLQNFPHTCSPVLKPAMIGSTMRAAPSTMSSGGWKRCSAVLRAAMSPGSSSRHPAGVHAVHVDAVAGGNPPPTVRVIMLSAALAMLVCGCRRRLEAAVELALDRGHVDDVLVALRRAQHQRLEPRVEDERRHGVDELHLEQLDRRHLGQRAAATSSARANRPAADPGRAGLPEQGGILPRQHARPAAAALGKAARGVRERRDLRTCRPVARRRRSPPPRRLPGSMW